MSEKARPVLRPTNDEDARFYRLSEIKPEEVSIVDRPANKRKFLVIKGESSMRDLVVIEKDDGTLTIAEAVTKAKPKDDEDEDAAKARHKKPDEEEEDAAKAKAKDEDADKTKKPEGAVKSGHLETGAREAAERLLSVANAAKAGKMTPQLTRELKAVAALVSALAQKYPSPVAARKNDDGNTVKVEADLIAKAAGDVSGLARAAAERLLTITTEKAPTDLRGVANALTGYVETVEKAKKPKDEEEDDDMEMKNRAKKPKDEEMDEEKAKKKGAKRFTPERTAKLVGALQSILSVMKDVGADGLSDLLNISKTEGTAEGEVIQKSLESIGIASDQNGADLRTELDSLKKRLEGIEAAGVSKALGNDGSPVKKSGSMWGGILGLGNK